LKKKEKIEPIPKPSQIEALLTLISGKDRCKTIRANKCTMCDGDANTFRDELSRKEYAISGMCQKCQDKVFKPDTEKKEKKSNGKRKSKK